MEAAPISTNKSAKKAGSLLAGLGKGGEGAHSGGDTVMEHLVSSGSGKIPNLTPVKAAHLTSAEIEQKLAVAEANRLAELAKVTARARVEGEVKVSEAAGKRLKATQAVLSSAEKNSVREREAEAAAAAHKAAIVDKAKDRNSSVSEAVAQSLAAAREASENAATERKEREAEAARKATAAVSAKKEKSKEYNERVASSVEKTLETRRVKAEQRRSETEELSAPFSPSAELADDEKPSVMRRLEAEARAEKIAKETDERHAAAAERHAAYLKEKQDPARLKRGKSVEPVSEILCSSAFALAFAAGLLACLSVYCKSSILSGLSRLSAHIA